MLAKENTQTDNEDEAALIGVVGALMQEVQPGRAARVVITLDSRLDADLGFDSLARVELVARIEDHFGVAFAERVFLETQTPRDLLRFLRSAQQVGRVKKTLAPAVMVSDEAVEGVPAEVQTLVAALRWHVDVHPNRAHIQFYQDAGDGETITYGRLWHEARRVAAGLQYEGISPSEPVAIMLPTSADYFYSFFGVLLAGGVPVSLYPPARRAQIGDHLRRHVGIINNCSARYLITVAEAKAFSRLLKSLAESVQHVVTVPDLAREANEWSEVTVTSADTAFIQYTSGSTGNPKGVVLSHANLLANVRAMGEAVNAGSKDVFVSWLPLYHDMGLIGAWLGSLYYACLFVVMSPLSFVARPQRWLWAIHRHRGTLSAAPNFAFELCLRRIREEDLDGLDLSSWRGAFNGAEPVDPDTLENFCRRFSRYGFRRESAMPVYGLAENSVGLTFPPLDRGPVIDCIKRETFMTTGRAVPAEPGDTHTLRFVACGVALVDHQVRVVDEAGRELPERREGYLHFRGPSSTSGYFRNQEATRQLFQGQWLNSGDRAYIDNGEVYITGRVKDIVIRAGRNIYPHELEEAVGGIDGIRRGRVAVFGCADSAFGTERLVVIAETRAKDSQERLRITNDVHEIAVSLTGEPADDVVLAPPNTILKTSSGKVRRAACSDIYTKGLIGKAPAAPWLQLLRVLLHNGKAVLNRFWTGVSDVTYAGYLWAALLALAVPTWLCVAILPRVQWRWAVTRFFAKLLIGASRIPVQVRGMEKLPGQDSPAVIVANHASYLDGIFLAAVLPYPVKFVAKAELLDSIVPRVFLRGIGAEFVERFQKEKSVEGAHRIAEYAREGRTIFYFPEGTFTRQPGLLPFRLGAFLAAIEADAPIIPITLRGTRSVLRADSWFPRLSPIKISVGNPIAVPSAREDTPRDRWRRAVALRNAARDEMLKYTGEPDLAREKHPI